MASSAASLGRTSTLLADSWKQCQEWLTSKAVPRMVISILWWPHSSSGEYEVTHVDGIAAIVAGNTLPTDLFRIHGA